jgi:hypothetical protein
MATIHGNHDTRQPYTSNGNDGNRNRVYMSAAYTYNRNDDTSNDTSNGNQYQQRHATRNTLHATRYTSNGIYMSAAYMATTTRYTLHEQPQPLPYVYLPRRSTRRCQLHTWQPQRHEQPQPCIYVSCIHGNDGNRNRNRNRCRVRKHHDSTVSLFNIAHENPLLQPERK